ncbi:hypothetical protein ETD86_45075 [Nonomuraea turkmeniaca]|uniref:NAD-dependent epimerase/dehydratase family protein n=1 Tax=Nonomuraea turkmeniaca TaxID=103838 RepID=A0A5S4EZE3_9ACTN|nr:hypothetical protein [Nonomuraea turkmeniaca]TMR09064.1 hypothetical protein ETD86_45075 [Nonomuraea turkmeniaca]
MSITKFAVAGATGRLGRHVVDVLTERGRQVVPMSRATGVDIMERCREHAARDLGPFAVEQVSISAGWGVWALAMLDLGYGRWEAVLDRLATAARGPIGHQVSAVCFAADEIEAAVRLGRADAAPVPFERLRRWAEAAALPWSDAVLERCRALLSLDDDPEAHFTAAVSCADRPFEQARSALVYGEWLRRSRRASDARIQLRHAAETFTLLGATLWAERAAAELRAAGETTPTRATGHDPVAGLTSQELQVVRLTARGRVLRAHLDAGSVGHRAGDGPARPLGRPAVRDERPSARLDPDRPPYSPGRAALDGSAQAGRTGQMRRCDAWSPTASVSVSASASPRPPAHCRSAAPPPARGSQAAPDQRPLMLVDFPGGHRSDQPAR